jgi:hypothetical protein
VKASSHSMDQTSVQELALAKPLKQRKKFSSQTSGLSIIEKTSSANVKIRRAKMSSTSAGGGGGGRAPNTLDLYDSGSSAFDGEATAPMPH